MITLSSTLLVAALALLAGALTTVAGMGGGLLLIVALSALWDPRFALAVTGPALLLGNIHRFWLYRADLDRRAALRYLAGGVPGALVGGWALLAAPPALLRGGMVVLAAMALLRSLGGGRFGLPQAALVPGGFATGFVIGVAIGVDPSFQDAASNDDLNHWCWQTTVMSSGAEPGTPGAANDACAGR